MLKALKTYWECLRLYPSALRFGRCQWMRGRYWDSINKGVEFALWDDGEFTFVVSEMYKTSPENERILGEYDERSIVNISIPTPFKKHKEG